MRKTLKILSLVLSAVLFMGVFSAANPALAAEVQENYEIKDNVLAKSEETESKTIAEIVEERDQYKKVYLCEDGSKRAIISSTPIHYLNNKKWENIDNTLVETKDKKSLKTKSNDFVTIFPKELTSNTPVIISKGVYRVEMYLMGTNNNSVKKTKIKKIKKNKSDVAEQDVIDKNQKVIYEEIDDNTDLEYIATSTGLKENIILDRKPKSEIEYTYAIKTRNLSIRLNDDKSVTFFNEAEEEVFNIPAPVMYDNKNNVSYDIEVKIEEKEEQAFLTYKPSYEWLKNTAKYPVVIDPEISTPKENDGVIDTYISSLKPTKNYNDASALYVSGGSSDERISLYNLSSNYFSIPNTHIKLAQLNVWSSNTVKPTDQPFILEAYSVDGEWNFLKVNYNTKPTIGEFLDKQYISSTSRMFCSFDITEAFSCGKPFYGVALKQGEVSGNAHYTKLLAAESSTEEYYRPYFVIEYYESQGVREQYDYHVFDVGRAGTMYYNDFTNQATIEREEIGVDGLHMPVKIKRFFNEGYGGTASNKYLSNYTVFSPYGFGWRTNYNQNIEYYDGIDGEPRVLYCDGEGKTTYFRNTSFLEEGAYKWEEVTDDFSTSKGYTLYIPQEYNQSVSDNLNTVKIKDSDGHIYEFNSKGQLIKIKESSEASAPSVSIHYADDDMFSYSLPGIEKIVDGAGREYRFTYTEYEQFDEPVLTSIQLYNSDGQPVKIKDDEGNPIDYKISYRYTDDTYGDTTIPVLEKAIYPDGEEVSYTYQNSKVSATNIDGYTIEVNKGSSGIVIDEYVKNGNALIEGFSLEITQNNKYQKNFIDSDGVCVTKQFDLFGRTINTVLPGGENLPRVYSADIKAKGEFTYGFFNCTEMESNSTQPNIITNGDFSSGLSSWDGDIAEIVTDSSADCDSNTTLKGAMRIYGKSDGFLQASQTINIDDGNIDDGYNLSFFVKNQNSRFLTGAYVDAYNETDQAWETVCNIDINYLNDNWQMYSVDLKVKTEYSKLRIVFYYFCQYGSLWIDNVVLTNTYKANSTNDNEESSESGTGAGCSCSYCADNCNCEHTGESVCTPQTCPECGECTCDGCTQLNCSCRDCSANCNRTSCKRGYTFEKSDEGIGFSITDGDMMMGAAQSYYGEYVGVYSDINDVVTEYGYNQDNGQLNYTENESGHKTEFTYDAMNRLKTVSQAVESLNGSQISTSYSYDNDKIKSVSHNGFSYNYEYDVWGNKTSVKVNQQPLVQYSYDSGQNRNRLNKITFANGDYTSYIYSEDGNITEIKSFSSENVLLSAYRYSYNELGGVSKIQNIAENTEVRYGAEGGKAFVLLNADGSADDEVLHSKNAGENDEMLENLGSVQYIETKGLPVSDSDACTTTNKKSIVSPLQKYDFSDTSDYFGRTKTKKARTTINSPDLEGTGIGAFFDYDVEFAYKDVNIGRTSTLVKSYKTSLSLRSDVVNESLLGDTEFVAEEVPYTENEYFYSYDSEGNITRIEKKIAGIGDSVQTTLLAGYVYDSVGQVVRENNAQQQKTYTYIYDESGNIVERKEYAFTEGNLGEVLSTRTFGYDNVWKDKLTSCGATQITTDALGNPTTTITKDILGEEKVAALEWNGRQLSSATIGLQRYEYSYNSDGLRTCVRTYNDGVLEQSFYYVWENEKLSGYVVKDDEGNEQYVVKLLYDNTGDSIGYEFYDVAGDKSYTMYFQKNLQGDITGVYSIDYGEILTYSYDAWGNVSIDYLDASVNEVIASMTAILYTPITYRGYMYDPFTGMYYLQSRYYNPSICRFLNVDDTDILEATQGTPLGANLFAYCNNNPVMNVDYTGENPIVILGADLVLELLLTAIVICIVVLIFQLCLGESTITENGTTYGTNTIIDALLTVYEYIKNSELLKTALYTAAVLATIKIANNQTADHHIIAQNSVKAKIARQLFLSVGGDINGDENLVTVYKNFHYFLHTNIYYIAVDGLIAESYYFCGDSTRKESVYAMLFSIKKLIIFFNGFYMFF